MSVDAPDTTEISLNLNEQSTSPSQLEEVTLDYDGTFTNSIGARSPINGPVLGRSVKEIEDQLTGLKKENFNLKLRIYFLEERMGINCNLDKENIIKKNVELMVEVENLRKDLKDKHELLCQADKALELQDDEYKKITDKKDEIIKQYRKEIDETKAQIIELKQNNVAEYSQEDTARILQEQIKALKDELLEEKERNTAFQLIFNQNNTNLKDLTTELDDIKQKLQKRDCEFDELSKKNCLLLKKLQETKQLINNLKMDNNNESNRKQYEFEQMKKHYDSLQIINEKKIAELQAKLEMSTADLKKSQELVVSSTKQELNHITDNNSFLVAKSTTSPNYTKTIPLSISPQNITFLSSPSLSSSSSSTSPSLQSLPSPTSSDTTDIIQMKNERDHYQQKTIKLKAEQLKACHIIKKMIERQNDADKEIDGLKMKIRELEEELEPIPSKSEQTSKNSTVGYNKELIETYKSRIDQLEEDHQVLLSTLEDRNSELQHYQNQQEELLKTIKEKDDQIVDLEFKITSNIDEKLIEYEYKLNEKNIEIVKLNNEISKKNCDLQGIVNKELWDKNREIEKFHITRNTTKIIEQKDDKIKHLEDDLLKKQQQLDMIKRKISELGIDINNDNYELKNHLHDELIKSEKLRYESNDVCTILSRRLEELAVFLDSLLKQKTILGFLGNKENRKLREIIDQSLDLTRSFTMSMLLNPDQSLTQLTNITNILNDTTIDHSLTFQSHLYNNNDVVDDDDDDDNNKENESQNNSQIIDALRQQIVTLKYELRLRDVELSKINDVNEKKCEKPTVTTTTTTTSTNLKYQSDIQSESESWSEPDRSVSRARIGLFHNDDSKSIQPTTPTIIIKKTTSESNEMCRNSRTPRKHEHRQIINELNQQLQELEQKYNDEQEKNRDLLENIDDLKIKQQQYEEQINQLESDKDKALNVAQEAEEVAVIAKNEMKSSEIKIQKLQKDMNDYQQQLEDDYKKRLQTIEDDMKIQIETLQNTLQQVRNDCVENCAKKYELNVALEQLETTEKLLRKSEQQITNLTQQQQINEQLLKDYQNKINSLYKDLDNSKLEYSEIVLEKTKLTNEKTSLEQELTNLLATHSMVRSKLDNIEKELMITRENQQKELLAIDEQKSRLELRISELESTNAQLQNRLIKIQTGYCNINNEQIFLSTSLPNYRRQLSDQSGYTSEEQQLNDNRNNCGVIVNNNNNNNNRRSGFIEIERHDGNSSPDLGIESDHGRFSSLETHLNVPRPLLQTLELTESMNNLLNGENTSVQTINCGDVRCNERTTRMTHENNDLKRELFKTKRVLEETVNQLALANQRKKQIEKTICRQIHKTSQVLKKAKANLDSGSETDLYKK